MRRNLRAAILLTLCILVTLALVIPHTVARWFNSPWHRRIGIWWHRCMCWLLGFRVEQRGQLAQSNGHGVFLAANHVSWTDIIVLSSLAPVSFVAKDEVNEWPIFGTFARWQESIFVDRNTRTGAKAQAEQINNRLARGDNIILFPEGTTTCGNFVGPFKSSLFGALGISGDTISSPIQPVSIVYTKNHGLPLGRYDRPLAAWPGDIELLPHLMGILRHGCLDVVVTFGEPIDLNENGNRKAISKAAYDSVARMTSSALRGH